MVTSCARKNDLAHVHANFASGVAAASFSAAAVVALLLLPGKGYAVVLTEAGRPLSSGTKTARPYGARGAGDTATAATSSHRTAPSDRNSDDVASSSASAAAAASVDESTCTVLVTQWKATRSSPDQASVPSRPVFLSCLQCRLRTKDPSRARHTRSEPSGNLAASARCHVSRNVPSGEKANRSTTAVSAGSMTDSSELASVTESGAPPPFVATRLPFGATASSVRDRRPASAGSSVGSAVVAASPDDASREVGPPRNSTPWLLERMTSRSGGDASACSTAADILNLLRGI
mmetsp:Transcript_958/g.3797  ORF Transcript_958/g.3797 Transcript_958/m.3797 type:complete len:291 (+) Transcript_958:1562-2434(+)